MIRSMTDCSLAVKGDPPRSDAGAMARVDLTIPATARSGCVRSPPGHHDPTLLEKPVRMKHDSGNDASTLLKLRGAWF
jgi:hypothetical protein